MTSRLDDDTFGDPKQRRIYIETMTALGEAIVSARVANRLPIGNRPEDNPPPEMTRIWLEETRKRRERIEGFKYWASIIIGIIAAAAAVVAAFPVVYH
jgi:hypothetical protein